MMVRDDAQHGYAICVRNDGFAASLELRKVYVTVADPEAARQRFVRVIDESGEDYLYPEGFFVPIELPREAAQAFAQAS